MTRVVREQTGLVDATIRVLAQYGWEGLTLDRVAAEAGSSRPTLWRQGITREYLAKALLERLTMSYRDAVFPALTQEGTGAHRLELAMNALYAVADEHLALLAASDVSFHKASGAEGSQRTSFVEPLRRLLLDGQADGSLAFTRPATDLAVVLFNSIWTYVHLRLRHNWAPERTRELLLELMLDAIKAGLNRKET